MNKLKTQNFNNLLNYQHFLKNNSLKKKRFKLKDIIFENPILYKNQDLNIIELENSENTEVPLTVLDFNEICTIESSYENQLLFNYNLNYNILYKFNKIMFNYLKNKNIIKGRLITGNRQIVLIAFLGLVFSMKSVNLNNLINNKKNFYLKRKKNKNLKHGFFAKFKKVKIKRILNSYKLRYLNYKVEKNKNKNIIFSRIAYLENIAEYLKIRSLKKRMILERNKKNKIKNNLSEKGYVKKQKNKK
jgi:hypothetical protein